jgi:SAM-dependent methyltransferase
VFKRSISPDPLRSSSVTDLFFDRLNEADIAAVEAAATDDEQRLLDTCDPASRRRLLVSLGVHHQIPGVLERTGLTPAMPPEDVHSMARGAAAAGGSLYYADMVVDGFAAGGFEPAAGTAILDFGCSSGRAVRPLAAAFPEADWHGCDPIAAAIDWAQANIAGVEFLHSPEQPPLPYADESLDAAYAISIWSHFNAPAAERWLHEMRRLIRPGGLLLLTTHGFQTIPHDRGTRRRSEEQLQRVGTALEHDGFWFEAEFGAAGDHGVMDPDWGTAFLTPEWLLKAVTPQWSVVSFAPGRVEDNQDLYVLERR